MKELLVQGKTTDTNEWICGGYYKHVDDSYNGPEEYMIEEDYIHYICGIIASEGEVVLREVISDTVRLYSGINAGSVRVFEKDILKFELCDAMTGERSEAEGMVIHAKNDFKVWVFKDCVEEDCITMIPLMSVFKCGVPKIIGNSIDNPDLIWII